MSIRIETLRLIDLIGDLKPTTAPDPDSGAINGILLHSERGYGFPGDPGKTDILVGTSTNRMAVGHTYAQCHGQMMRLMLWPLQSALAIVTLFKPATKDNKEHTLEISFDGANVHVQEDPDLFGEGTKFEFTAGDVTKFPRGLWKVLEHDKPYDHTSGAAEKTGPLPRTDIPAAGMLPFVTVAARHGGVIELFRWHQRRALLVQIGDRYRGALIPSHWPDDKNPQAGHGPNGDVYTPDLPPEQDSTVKVNPDSLLEQACELVVSTQMASTSMVQRKLRVGFTRAQSLLDELELIGLVGAANGTRARDVLITPAELDKALEKIRAREHAAGQQHDAPAEAVSTDG